MSNRFQPPEIRDADIDELPPMMTEEPEYPGLQVSLMPAMYERIENVDEGSLVEQWRLVAFIRNADEGERVLRVESTTTAQPHDTAKTVVRAFGFKLIETLALCIEEPDDVD